MSQQDIHFDEIISRYRSDPYDYVDIYAVHAGKIKFLVEEGADVEGVTGEWKHVPGSKLYEIDRENNAKTITSQTNGVVSSLHGELDGEFVEAGEKLMTIRHPLKKKESLPILLLLWDSRQFRLYEFEEDRLALLEGQWDLPVVQGLQEETRYSSLIREWESTNPQCEKGIHPQELSQTKVSK